MTVFAMVLKNPESITISPGVTFARPTALAVPASSSPTRYIPVKSTHEVEPNRAF